MILDVSVVVFAAIGLGLAIDVVALIVVSLLVVATGPSHLSSAGNLFLVVVAGLYPIVATSSANIAWTGLIDALRILRVMRDHRV